MQKPLKTYESLWYTLPNNLGVVEFTVDVLEYFSRYQQKCVKAKEAGGQLFWKLAAQGHRQLVLVTGPRKCDKRTRTSYKSDWRAEQREIDKLYKKELHWLGDWHTHPELIPKPSTVDIQTIKEVYSKTQYRGPGILMVVVGTKDFPEGLSVSWCDGRVQTLKPRT